MAPERYRPSLIAGRLCDDGVSALGVDEIAGSLSHANVITTSKQMAQPDCLHTGSFQSVIFPPMDTAWTQIEDPWERLKWARLQAGFGTATAAAESLGMKKDTYSAYERAPGTSKHTSLDHQTAIAAGRKFKVSWTWLLVAEGTPFDRPTTEPQRRAIDAMRAVPEERQAAVADAIEALLKSQAA
jgi:hypothetical protein